MIRLFQRLNPRRQFVLTLLMAMAVCAGLFIFGTLTSNSGKFSYLVWNLFLSALPLAFALRLLHVLRTKRWSDWSPLGWTLAWLLFLPNSFYMISDFIHLREISSEDILFNAVMFTSFIYLGVLLGFCSLYVVHHELRRRLVPKTAAAWVGGILFLCSFAIYIGRDLRWNSWDVITNPAGLLFDISDRLIRPEDYPGMFVVLLSFFALLGSLYAVVWSAARLLRRLDMPKVEPGR